MVASSVRPPAQAHIPKHVAIIMDGNGRWAKRRALSRPAGHQAGIRPVRETVESCAAHGVQALTLFAFSSENWRRPPAEVSGLMTLFFDALGREIAELHSNGIRVKFIGDRSKLSPALDKATREAEIRTAANTRMQLVIAVAYGGRWDLAQAARALAADVQAGVLALDAIDEKRLGGALQTADLPPVDLLIRTGGEQRISNFLLWDIAYSELFFSDVFWPEFTSAELSRAFEFYAHRQRRFGHTGEQIEATRC